MNVFTTNFDQRLEAWYILRQTLKQSELEHICVEVDKFWQQCPLNTYYLHPHDIQDWPGPWQLIHDNVYCYYARALGMLYTLALLGINEVDFVSATDYNNIEVVLVLVDNAKYVMNYWPACVLNTQLGKFTNIKHIDTKTIYNNIN